MTARQWQSTVPLVFVGAGLLASDTAIEEHVPTNPSTVSHAVTFSNAGVAALAGVGGGMFLLGHITHNDQQRETGLLAGEAGIDAYLDTTVFNYAFGRQRPFTGDGRGLFFQGGDSFPSQHAAVGWAIASVIAHEYPGPLTQVLAYGTAGAISAARFAGQQHFATDVLVGSALGWYMGRQVFRAHSHYSDAEAAQWGTFSKSDKETVPNLGNMGSSYVPLDTWVYPAMERLVALGYIQSADLGMRPWTRMECARLLVEEAVKQVEENNEPGGEQQKVYAALSSEFSDEIASLGGAPNLGLELESVYTRLEGISGTPLRDGLHFGQTIVNDYGRPYAEGFNNVTGFISHAEAGPLSFFMRGEYQHAPSASPLSIQASQVIQSVDGLPTAPPLIPTPAVNRFDVLEGYVGLQLNNWQISFGKQSLWWGEDESGPMLFSTNAEPILMLQVNRVKPFRLPSILGVFGPMRIDYMVGRIDGYHWVYGANSGFVGSWTQSLSNEPFIVGEKVSFKPSDNLELGISATALFGGPGVPATTHQLLKAMFSTGNGLPGTPGDAGDRRGGFDFAYRVPGLRDWLTLYADAFTDDEPNPWLAWNKAAFTFGLYLSHVPWIPKLDFRVEGIFTDLPGGEPTVQHGFFYSNSRFKSGYTNDGNLIGSWIGRQGQGAEAWTDYWLSARSKVQLNFRHQKVSSQFIPLGGSLTDIGASVDLWVHSNLDLEAMVQYERWLLPAIEPNASRNVTAALQLSLQPKRLFKHSQVPSNQP
ncbi:MAG TPA: capsule assembly Wzi family protein [Terriglobales bacterium]|nr:capsule assembly Wzi family protein [Terriglobales bacterium]